MKNKFLAILATVMAVSLSFGTVVEAAEPQTVQTVTLASNNTLSYNTSNTLASAFNGMAGGDERTVAIKVTNNNDATANFYVSQSTLETLEELGKSSGGAYELSLKIGSTEASAITMAELIGGGVSASGVASDAGLDAAQLNGFQFFAELAKGDSTNLYITLKIDGEGFDSTSASNYSNAVGRINFDFRATADDPAAPGVRNVFRTVTGARTGDSRPIIGVAVLLAIGIVLIAVSSRKRKEA